MKTTTALAVTDEETTTLRVPTELRNNLKVIAAAQKMTLRDLTVSILEKHVKAYEAGINLPLSKLNQRTRRS